MTSTRTGHNAPRRPKPKRNSRYAAPWRPSWNDYAELTMAADEKELVAFVGGIIRKFARRPRVSATRPVLSAIARAGLIGDAPGWRRALRDDFSGINLEAVSTAITAMEKAIALGAVTPADKWTGFLKRAVTASRRMKTACRAPLQTSRPDWSSAQKSRTSR